MSIKFFPNQYFTCVNCGKCCGAWEVPVTFDEKTRIGKLRVPGAGGDNENFILNGKFRGVYLIRKKCGRCVFLGKDNLCEIHRRHGEMAKPLACRIYPMDIYNWEDGVTTASFRFDCPAVVSQKGRKIAAVTQEISSISRELSSRRKTAASAVYRRDLNPGLKKLRTVASGYGKFLLDSGLRPSIRILAASKLLEFHSHPGNSSDIADAGDFFGRDAMELVKRSVPSLENLIAGAAPLNFHQKMVFRYLLSGFIRSDEEHALGFLPVAKLSRVKSILKFSLGSGSLEKISGRLPDTARLDPVDAVSGAEWERDAFDVYWNYLGSKLESLHFCGSPCLNLSFEDGMRHLLVTYPVLAYFSALLAKSGKRDTVSGKDVAEALSYVDHTFSRSPFFAIRHVMKMTRSFCSEAVLASALKHLP